QVYHYWAGKEGLVCGATCYNLVGLFPNNSVREGRCNLQPVLMKPAFLLCDCMRSKSVRGPLRPTLRTYWPLLVLYWRMVAMRMRPLQRCCMMRLRIKGVKQHVRKYSVVLG